MRSLDRSILIPFYCRDQSPMKWGRNIPVFDPSAVFTILFLKDPSADFMNQNAFKLSTKQGKWMFRVIQRWNIVLFMYITYIDIVLNFKNASSWLSISTLIPIKIKFNFDCIVIDININLNNCSLKSRSIEVRICIVRS